MKCHFCNSRNIIEIENPKVREYKSSDGNILRYFMINKCLNCGAEFNMRRAKET